MISSFLKIFIFTNIFGFLYCSETDFFAEFKEIEDDPFFVSLFEFPNKIGSNRSLANGKDDSEFFDPDPFRNLLDVSEYEPEEEEILSSPTDIDDLFEFDFLEPRSGDKLKNTCHKDPNQDEEQLHGIDGFQKHYSDERKQRNQLKEVKCLTEAELDRGLVYPDVFQHILTRFRSESKKSTASKINWNLLNREHIPKKYENVPINSIVFRSQLIFKNREIVDNIHFFDSESDLKKSLRIKQKLRNLFKSQFPGKRHHFQKYDIINWPLGIDSHAPHWPGTQIEEIDKAFPSLRFVERLALTDQAFELDELSDLKVDNTSNAASFNAAGCIMTSELGNRQDGQIEDHEDGQIRDLRYGQNYISDKKLQSHFSIKTQILHQLIEFKCLKEAELDYSFSRREVFQTLLTRYRSESKQSTATKINWNLLNREHIPKKYENVPINSIVFGSQLIFKNREIVDNIHFFESESEPKKSYYPGKRYRERSTAFDDHSVKIVELNDLEVGIQNNLKRGATYNTLLERFRVETELNFEAFIDWNLLNREAIPHEYKDIKINEKTINNAEIYQNQEIIDNIHFFKASVSRRNFSIRINRKRQKF